jgi:hypothetical protein
MLVVNCDNSHINNIYLADGVIDHIYLADGAIDPSHFYTTQADIRATPHTHGRDVPSGAIAEYTVQDDPLSLIMQNPPSNQPAAVVNHACMEGGTWISGSWSKVRLLDEGVASSRWSWALGKMDITVVRLQTLIWKFV